MEFRHPSWIEAKDLLLSQGVAWCVAETDEKDPGPTTCPGSRSATCACARPSTRTRSSVRGPSGSRPALDAGADVFCYFKHEDDGAGPKMAKRLRETLEDRAPDRASA